MDHFGIGAAMRAMLLNYEYASRRTGRTVSLIESVKDGDRIVFVNRTEALRVKELCAERGVKVDCIVVPVERPQELFEKHATSEGRTIFDHTWVEHYYKGAIENASESIDHLQRESSGYGEAHRETRRAAQERMKWGKY